MNHFAVKSYQGVLAVFQASNPWQAREIGREVAQNVSLSPSQVKVERATDAEIADFRESDARA